MLACWIAKRLQMPHLCFLRFQNVAVWSIFELAPCVCTRNRDVDEIVVFLKRPRDTVAKLKATVALKGF